MTGGIIGKLLNWLIDWILPLDPTYVNRWRYTIKSKLRLLPLKSIYKLQQIVHVIIAPSEANQHKNDWWYIQRLP